MNFIFVCELLNRPFLSHTLVANWGASKFTLDRKRTVKRKSISKAKSFWGRCGAKANRCEWYRRDWSSTRCCWDHQSILPTTSENSPNGKAMHVLSAWIDFGSCGTNNSLFLSNHQPEVYSLLSSNDYTARSIDKYTSLKRDWSGDERMMGNTHMWYRLTIHGIMRSPSWLVSHSTSKST